MIKTLVSLDEYKTYREVNSDDFDNKLSTIIASVSELVKNYCNRTFIEYAKVNKIEYFNAKTISEYYVEEIPIIEVASLNFSIDGGVTYTEAVKNEDYFVDEDMGSILTGTSRNFLISGIGHKSGKLIYKAGFLEIPKDLKLATMDLVKYYADEEYTPRKAFQGMTIENVGFREGGGIGLPAHIRRVLGMYRVVM